LTTLYLADDQQMLLSALTTLLNLEEDFDVVGSAGDGQTALEDIRRLKPEVAILDIEMPKRTGLDVAEQLRAEQQDVKIII
jgi:two-component system response regulator DesR